MEVHGGSNMKGTVWLYEMIGTAILCVAVNWGAGSDGHQAHCVALALMGIAMFLGPVCGGHVNPAVSLGVLIREPDEKRGSNAVIFIGNVIAQILGGILGCAFCFLGYKVNETAGIKTVSPTMAALCPPVSGDDLLPNSECKPGPAAVQALIAEIVGTFIFVSVVLSVKYKNGSVDALNAMTVAGALFCALTIAAPTSGAAINPAVGIAQTVFQSFVSDQVDIEGHKKTILSIWIYIVGPLIGGALAGIFARFINETALDKQKEAIDSTDGRLF